MTVFLRDCSDFDTGTIDVTGLAGLTHKATEGTGVTHTMYGPRLSLWRTEGVPVLGSYHVLRTPGSGGAGSLQAQLDFWVSYMDSQTSWWRNHPHWILQVDAERWTYDDVQPSTVLDFASLLARSGLPGWKVTYASRGQYGDALRGIATPLWNADYRNNGTYPGDNWTSDNGAPAGWASYSGVTPTLLQYREAPDLNAFRGSLDELLALTGGTTMSEWTAAPDASQPWVLTQGTAGYAGQQRDTALAFAWQAAHDANDKAGQILANQANPVPVQVDAAAVAAALIADPNFIPAIAKAVNDEAARRLAS
jgi:hypothetical protein